MLFTAVVQPRLQKNFAEFSNFNRTLTITLPPFPTYDVISAETIVLTIPDTAVTARQRPHNYLHVVVDTIAGLAELNGTWGLSAAVIPEVTEESVQTLAAAPLIFTVSLTNDTWNAGIGTVFGSASSDLLVSFSSAQSEPIAWNNIVRPGLSVFDLLRVDDTTLQITLPHFPRYEIELPETISLAVPATSLLSRHPIAVSPSFRVLATPGVAYLKGGLLSNLTQTAINLYPQELRIVVAGGA